TPLVRWMQRRGAPLSLGVSAALLGDTIVLVGFVALLVVSTSELSSELPKYVDLMQARTDALTLWLARYGLEGAITEVFDARVAVSLVASLIGNLAGVVWSLGIALIVAFFLLLRFGGLRPTSE